MTGLNINELLLNRSNQQKKSDRFYVSFFNINKNVSNYLGSQVKSVSRPSVDVDTIQHRKRGAEYADTGHLRFKPVTVTFSDDEESIISMLIYAQLMRQKKKYRGEVDDLFGNSDQSYKFGMQIEMYNSRNEVTEGYLLKDCFITDINHSEQIYSGDNANEISITLAYDNIEVKVFDQYLDLSI